ncbi:MAG: hypothetical protein CL799_03150 [Chromatiales bacterium]|nr:hypothetical protein [Chromatiales bacterium]
MKALIRWLAIIIGGLILLSILLSVAVSILVDPNDYRAEIETAVADATGRTLTIDGELSLKTFPCCGVRLGSLSLSNPPGFPDKPFASIDSAAVSVQVLPLILSQELHVGQVELAGLDLQMISRADGVTNWEIGEATATEATEEPAAADAGQVELGVAGVSVSDGRISYRDEATGDDIRLDDINITIGSVAIGEPFSLSMAFNVQGLLEGMTNAVLLETIVSLDLDTGSVALENLSLTLDDSVAKGWIRIPDMNQDHIAFDLEFDALDADRYMGPPVPEPESDSEAADTGDEPLDLPVEDMRALDIDGRLGIGRLKASGATLTDVHLVLVAKDGLIRLNPFTADLYGGSYTGDVQLDVRGQKPKISLNDILDGVQLGKLLTDMSGEAQLSGIGNFSIDATAAGNTTNEMMGTLTGDLSLSMDEGKYLGTDVWYEIRKAKAKISKSDPPEEPADSYTDVTEFSGSAHITNGVVRNDDFKAGAPYLRLSGKGIVNLVPETLDYQLIANIVGTPDFGDDEGLGVLEGIDIAIGLTGPMDSPEYKFEGNSLLSGAIEKEKEKFQERTEEKKEEVREKVKDKLNRFKDKLKF